MVKIKEDSEENIELIDIEIYTDLPIDAWYTWAYLKATSQTIPLQEIHESLFAIA